MEVRRTVCFLSASFLIPMNGYSCNPFTWMIFMSRWCHLANKCFEIRPANPLWWLISEPGTREVEIIIVVVRTQNNIIEAKRDSAVQVINAMGEASAIREKQLALSAEYVEYQKIMKWMGNFQLFNLVPEELCYSWSSNSYKTCCLENA